jgi:ribosomal protein S18 acetylase RimI-like enzyme
VTVTEAAVRTATADDVEALAVLAARTFPLACPPHTTAQEAADFVSTHLSAAHLARYVADPQRAVLVVDDGGSLVGYAMLVLGEPSDADAAAAIRMRPTAELSKCYVAPELHGGGTAQQLMSAALAAARDRGAVGVWLGVNEENARAIRFYRKCGFEPVGRKRFLVGGRWEDDHVLERAVRSTVVWWSFSVWSGAKG